jgi:hypothetical protein
VAVSHSPPAPDELSVLENVNAVDPIRRFPECPMGIESHGKRLCPPHRRLVGAAQTIEDVFCRTMVSDLLEVPRARKRVCGFPVVEAAS